MSPFSFIAAQNYQAIHGSSYAGSLAVGNNPASIIHVPYAWDITPIAVQLKQSTNAFRIKKYSFLSSPANVEIESTTGTFSRFQFSNEDARILNARFTLNSKLAIAFGANIRNYQYANTSISNWQDTIFNMADYMKVNQDHLPLSAEMRASSWGELYGTVALTILEKDDWVVNGGLTLKLIRTLAGGYARADDLRYINVPGQGRDAYRLTTGNLQYGYSRNFDAIDSRKSSSQNRRDFIREGAYGVGGDLGLEFIRLAAEDANEENPFAYETKVGIAVLDLGSTTYQYGSRSRLAVAGRPGITDTVIENKMVDVTSFDRFNDSLAGLAESSTPLSGQFSVYMPARLVVNVDQHITGNFFLNAEVTVQLSAFVNKNVLALKDMNLAALTPRWELRSLAAYIPIVYNTRKQVWVGGAFRVGPLLLGTHNLANVFAKNTNQTGGAYLALTLRPGKLYDRGAHYPGDKLSRKARRRLNCPEF